MQIAGLISRETPVPKLRSHWDRRFFHSGINVIGTIVTGTQIVNVALSWNYKPISYSSIFRTRTKKLVLSRGDLGISIVSLAKQLLNLDRRIQLAW